MELEKEGRVYGVHAIGVFASVEKSDNEHIYKEDDNDGNASHL